jgi:anti-sigma factor RsiW
MAQCDEIGLLLGAFEDGELEPHEMQEVARHVVQCSACEAELNGYRQLGIALRSAAPLPNLNGFTDSVIARIDQLPAPFFERIRKYLGAMTENLAGAMLGGLAGAAVAIVTAILITPYARQLIANRHPGPQTQQIAMRSSATAAGQAAPSEPIASAAPDVASPGPSEQHGFLDASSDAGRPSAVISRLEADSPSVAVWSEPRNDTTVIWVPDQSR